MPNIVDIQNAFPDPLPISLTDIKKWVEITLNTERVDNAELTLRIITSMEMKSLNNNYRSIDNTTNVLAFPACIDDEIDLEYKLLGDIVICPEVLSDESRCQKIEIHSHWAHIVIHGTLHLLGYDHIKESDAILMQGLEVKIMSQLGFDTPYLLEEKTCE